VVLGAGAYFFYDYHQSEEAASVSVSPTATTTPNPSPVAPPIPQPPAQEFTLSPLDRLKLAAASNPEDPNRWFELAVAHRTEKRYPESKSAYRMALRLMPDDFFLNVSYRMFLIESGEEEVLTAKLQDFQDKGEAVGADWQIVQAAMAVRNGKTPDAESVWQSATESLPAELVEALLKDPMLAGFR